MRADEKWPHTIYQGREYATGEDNGCFYRFLGPDRMCVGPVDKTDRLGNKFCRGHFDDMTKRDPDES